jgi:hypothetical protein
VGPDLTRPSWKGGHKRGKHECMVATVVLEGSGGAAARAEDAQGTRTQSHISQSILVYEDKRTFLSLSHIQWFITCRLWRPQQVTNSSDAMYLSISFRKSCPLQNRKFDILISNNEK